MNTQLADLIRPQSLDDIVGQTRLFGKNGILRKMSEQKRLGNMIFYGPPGTGKTTAARILAKTSDMTFRYLNATTASLSDVKAVLEETDTLMGSEGILLYLDEIQYFNKKQQQSLLEFMEDGRITLIASTTDNPQFAVYNAVLSRSSLYEFRPVTGKEMAPVLQKAVKKLNEDTGLNKILSLDDAIAIGNCARGDVRHGIVLLENAYFASDTEIKAEILSELDTSAYNFNDDTHYDLLSCLQKSIRGSDPDAALFYLAKLLSCGELLSAVRRLQVIASEDIGLAYPLASVVTRACCESALDLGMPEATLPLSNAVAMLATAPKSNTAHVAYEKALEALQMGKGMNVPKHLQSPLFEGYQYPHDFPNHYVPQQYLPDDLKDTHFYTPGENKTEQTAAEYWKKIKSGK